MPRPRFTLRVALAVTAIVAVLAWKQTDWIRQRRAAIASGNLTPMFADGPRPPQLLGLLGERGYIGLRLREPVTSDEMARLQALFPEASIHQPLTK
jgi:hypothetical protein